MEYGRRRVGGPWNEICLGKRKRKKEGRTLGGVSGQQTDAPADGIIEVKSKMEERINTTKKFQIQIY